MSKIIMIKIIIFDQSCNIVFFSTQSLHLPRELDRPTQLIDNFCNTVSFFKQCFHKESKFVNKPYPILNKLVRFQYTY